MQGHGGETPRSLCARPAMRLLLPGKTERSLPLPSFS
jgi:hypothetical protein